MTEHKGGKTIQSVQRAIDILNCFQDMDSALTLGQISAKLDLNKSTVHGILNTLLHNDFIRQNPSGQYMLGAYFVHKFGSAQLSLGVFLKERSRESMVRFANKYGVSCGLFKLELGELVRVNWIQPQDFRFTILSHATHINSLYCSASGKLLLAHLEPQALEEYLENNPLTPYTPKTISNREKLLQALDSIRREGYGVENEELALDVYALSVPIYDNQGAFFATVGATGTVSYLRPNKDAIVADLKLLAQEISHQIFR